MDNKIEIKIVIIDDSFAIRYGIKTLISRFQNRNSNIHIFTASNGVEGLGLIFAVQPDIIIIDTTLPKYSGRELIDFVTTNPTLRTSHILALHEDGFINFPSNILLLKKGSDNFINILNDYLYRTISKKSIYFIKNAQNRNLFNKSKYFVVKNLLHWANRADIMMHKISYHSNSLYKLLLTFPWLITQLLISVYLSVLYILVGKNKDENIEQFKLDNNHFRVKVYPTLATFMASILILLFQLSLFILGGITIFNHRVTSIFAIGNNNVSLNFVSSNQDSFSFDHNLIEFTSSGSKLKTFSVPTEEISIPNITNTPTPQSSSGEILNLVNPDLNTTSSGSINDVLGIDDSLVQNSIKYSTDSPFIINNDPIMFSDLIDILEYSSVNDDSSSIDYSLLDTQNSFLITNNSISYQLSPNGSDWFYFEYGSLSWQATSLGFESSNNIQTVNKYLNDFESLVNSNSLFLKIFLHSSDGLDTPIINKIIIEKNDKLVSEVNGVKEDTGSGTIMVQDISDLPDLPVPVILNAAFVNGNKVVSGYVSTRNSSTTTHNQLSIPDYELNNYSVNIYFTNSTDISKAASDKGDLIGSTNLQKIMINGVEQYVFELKTPSISGGYVTAELSYTTTNGVTRHALSLLSKPIENSTFTVNETGDQSDASPGDGSCDRDISTPGIQCTLRAAIQEANALSGADNIYFNIPTSDPGYRDYDLPDTPSSGDSLGGDDYWTIRPTSSYPSITGETHIVGSTQTTNQFDSNSYGPEIELNGINTAPLLGIIFGSGSNNSSISYFVINNYDASNKIALSIGGNYITVDNNYFGTCVKGMVKKNNNVSISSSSGGIHNTTITNNLINGNAGIILSNASYITIQSNIFGLNIDQTQILGGVIGIGYSNATIIDKTDIIIGGDNKSEGNVFGGLLAYAIYYSGADSMRPSKILNSKIKNNIFGTNSAETLVAPNDNDIDIRTGSQGWNNQSMQLDIADNVMMNTGSDSIMIENIKDFSIRNNRITNASRFGVYIQYTEENSWLSDYLYESPGTGPILENEGIVENNIIENSGEDGILLIGSSPTIKGNLIQNNTGYGININNYENSRTAAFQIDSSHYLYSRPIIGGSDPLSGSQCVGSEKNCFNNNGFGGISILNTAPWNEPTIYNDNSFSNSSENSIEQKWSGLFELFSNNIRRTDLTNSSISLALSNFVQGYTSGSNITLSCRQAVTCPDQGVSNSNGKTSFFGPGTMTLSSVKSWYPIYEYVYDSNGQKVTFSPIQFDQNHISSQIFSFDGNASTNPANTSSARTITIASTSQTFYDRGEPWTDSVTANRDTRMIAPQGVNPTGLLNHQYVFSNFQIMEVELVDANPVRQSDGSFIITVDSTSNEDNVSSSGFDDGYGAYSGGGSQGSDGLANGKTSLKEAIIVANNFNANDAQVKINFNIPVSDSNHKCYRNDGVSGQITLGNAVTTAIKDDPICGGTSIDPDYPYSWFDLSTTGTYTISRPVIIDGYSQDGSILNTTPMGGTLNNVIKISTNDATFTLTGGNSTITGITMPNGTAGITLNSNNNWLKGINLGTEPAGLLATGTSHSITVNGSGNVIGSNIDGDSDASELNILNTFTPTGTLINITLNGNNTKINNNYINTDRTGVKTGNNFVGGNVIFFNNLGIGTIGYIEIQNNILANNQYAIRSSGSFTLTKISIRNNRMNTSWEGNIALKNNSVSSSTAVILQSNATTGVEIRDNIIKNYNIRYSDKAFVLTGGGISDNSVIDNNLVQNCSKAFDINSSTMTNKTNNLVFSNNKFLDISNPIGTKIVMLNLNNSVIDNNTFANFGYNVYFGNISNTVLKRNKFGTDDSGTIFQKINGGITIGYSGDNSNITIGGDSFEDANIIATRLEINEVKNVKISHNLFGTDITGRIAFPINNGMSSEFRNSDGEINNNIFVGGSDGTWGGPALYFSFLNNSNFSDITIHDNCFGTQIDCTSASSLIGGAIYFESSYNLDNNISIFNNVIANATSNTFLGDYGNGIGIFGVNNNINIYDNKIYNNQEIGINLDGGVEDSYGVTANDTGDADTGPNNLMNFPVITDVEYLGAGQYKISGDIDGNLSEGPFDIEICESENSLSGHGDCIQTLGHTTANSPWNIIVTITGDDGSQSRIFSALATNNSGSTSEFSSNYAGYDIILYPVNLIFPIDNISIDDKTPLLDWYPSSNSGTLNPDIDHYEIYLDGSFLSTTNYLTTNYQLQNTLSLGSHSWQVVAYRNNGVETGRSDVEYFNIIEPDYSFSPIYPVNITIDDTLPLFDWTDIAPSSSSGSLVFDYYNLYIDDKLAISNLTNSEYQLDNNCIFETTNCELTEGNHNWFVIAYRIEPDSSITEVGRTIVASFNISLPIIPTGEEIIITPIMEKPEDNLSQLNIITILIILVSFITSFVTTNIIVYTDITTSIGTKDVFTIPLGLISLFSLPYKNKAFGIVYDKETNEGIPLARIRLLDPKKNEEIIHAHSDFKGRFSLRTTEKGSYILEAKVSGYINYSQTYKAEKNKNITILIPMVREYPRFNQLKILLYYKKLYLYTRINLIVLILLFAALILSTINFIFFPNTINLVVLIISILVPIYQYAVLYKNTH